MKAGIIANIRDRRINKAPPSVATLINRDHNKLEKLCDSLNGEFPGSDIYKELDNGRMFWRGKNLFGDGDRINLGGVGVIKLVDAAASYLRHLRMRALTNRRARARSRADERKREHPKKRN